MNQFPTQVVLDDTVTDVVSRIASARMQERLECHDVEGVSFGVPPIARGCKPVAANTLRQLVCDAGSFQQRTAWVAARLSAHSVSTRGVQRFLLVALRLGPEHAVTGT
jgi:hypothetical protein